MATFCLSVKSRHRSQLSGRYGYDSVNQRRPDETAPLKMAPDSGFWQFMSRAALRVFDPS